ncbi:hypothetical protein SCUP234_04774 [Seiridium cupressi]
MLSSSCEDPPQYHTVPRTVIWSLLWIAIIGAYIPQYSRIRTDGTKGISPYYILNHGLFSTTTLALRFSHSVFYVTFNCVVSGELEGWKGYSASLDFIAVFVQWACAMVLFAVYVRHRTPAVLPDQAPVRRLSDWAPEEMHEHKLTSDKMRRILIAYSAVTLPISLVLLFFNGHPYFQQDRPRTVFYVVFWSIWIAFLCAMDAFLVAFQFIKQLKTFGRLRTRGALSIVSVFALSVVLILLALTQFFRSRGNISLPREHHVSFGRFLQLFGWVYGCVSVDVMYLVAGLGYLVLLQLCLVFDWNDLFGTRFAPHALLRQSDGGHLTCALTAICTLIAVSLSGMSVADFYMHRLNHGHTYEFPDGDPTCIGYNPELQPDDLCWELNATEMGYRRKTKIVDGMPLSPQPGTAVVEAA